MWNGSLGLAACTNASWRVCAVESGQLMAAAIRQWAASWPPRTWPPTLSRQHRLRHAPSTWSSATRSSRPSASATASLPVITGGTSQNPFKMPPLVLLQPAAHAMLHVAACCGKQRCGLWVSRGQGITVVEAKGRRLLLNRNAAHSCATGLCDLWKFLGRRKDWIGWMGTSWSLSRMPAMAVRRRRSGARCGI